MKNYKITIHLIGNRRIQFKKSHPESREDLLSSLISEEFSIFTFDSKSILIQRDKIIDIEIADWKE